ncbi:protein TRANSPARENT TESTA 9-like isoform X1 [Populus alba x Populus x berolinensis]|uniref:Protein TRANSPARENT TESTA 9-like isoform X1 n=1 Tax=Populus alba x Populus x berolinensis TaxID=444605 RepID=A0AAD6QQD6_9ROSI|nr:protein TRANSPARENT TESTA 9-like isoform X1 [Populus alba x Populus x berolinensis]
MWRSLWRSIDRFSLQHFKHVINELQKIKVVDMHNRELVVDLLQSIVEIVTYGDRQDSQIFECFMEHQVLAEFVRVLKISKNSRIEAPLLQYLSIMIQNMDSEYAIYYCLSNDYVNNIITHPSVSNKINGDTLCLLVKVHGDAVVSFPLYSEALKFAQHGEKMIQTAIRALTLNIYNVGDDMVYQFITTPPVSSYFSDLIHNLKEQCTHLDNLVHALEEMGVNQRRKELLLKTDRIVDDLYYLKDILCVGESRLSKVVTQNVLNLLLIPILHPLLHSRQSDGSNLSPITSLYIVSCLIQVIGGKSIVNYVAGVLLYPYMSLSVREAWEACLSSAFFSNFNDMEKSSCSTESEGAESVNGSPLHRHFPEGRILDFILSDNHSLSLASLFLLLTLAESKDLEDLLASMVSLSAMQHAPQVMEESILVKFMPQILNALLNVLASEPPTTVQIKWHTGWFLRKLLVFQGIRLDEHNFHQFNTSYERSCICVEKELDGCWFDHIMDVLRNEWASCKTALEESSQSKDPLFLLEFTICQIADGDATSSHVAWQRMVDVVKVFILHLQLKAFISKGEFLEKSSLDSIVVLPFDSAKNLASGLSSASFGSEVSLGSGIPCRIAFSNAGIRDIYLIPVARGISGKLLLVEKHPFRSQRGVVIAIAPLAGLSPKIDEDQPTWLHLRIREFEPRINGGKNRSYNMKEFIQVADGRWTIGFPNAKACGSARLAIVEETSKQRSSVRNALGPLLQNDYGGGSSDRQDGRALV